MNKRKNNFIPYRIVKELYNQGFAMEYGEDFGSWRLKLNDEDYYESQFAREDEDIVLRERNEDLYSNYPEVCKAPLWSQVFDFSREKLGFNFIIFRDGKDCWIGQYEDHAGNVFECEECESYELAREVCVWRIHDIMIDVKCN